MRQRRAKARYRHQSGRRAGLSATPSLADRRAKISVKLLFPVSWPGRMALPKGARFCPLARLESRSQEIDISIWKAQTLPPRLCKSPIQRAESPRLNTLQRIASVNSACQRLPRRGTFEQSALRRPKCHWICRNRYAIGRKQVDSRGLELAQPTECSFPRCCLTTRLQGRAGFAV